MSTVMERDWRPRYLQLAEDLREKILKGELPPGAPMPSETVLAEQSGISRTSVRHAIQTLREWGLVRAEQGRGTYVRRPRQRVQRKSAERYQWEKERALLPEDERLQTGATEHDTGLLFEDLEFHAQYEEIAADEDLAARFGIAGGTPLLRRTYWTSSRNEDAPLSISRSYLVRDMVAANPDLTDSKNEPWPGGTPHQLSTVGIELDRIVDEITARPPLPDEALTLDTDPGVSVLVLRKTSVDTRERVVEVADVIMPGDRTELVYTTKLERWA